MHVFTKRHWRYVLSVIAIFGWIWWDLTQAHDVRRAPYQSFLAAGDVTMKTTAATTVAIVRSDDPALANPCAVTDEGISGQTIAQMVRRAVDLAGGLRGVVKTGDTVLIKPNLVQADSSGSGGITDVRVVKALVFLVDEIDHGRITILVGDGSPRPFTTFEKASGTSQRPWKELFDVPGYQLLKAEALAAGIDFRLTNLNGDSATNPWPELDSVKVPGGGSAQPQGGHYFVHRDVTHASVYITVPVLKIHQDVGLSCALKNQIGIAPSTRYGFNKTTGVLQDNRTHKLLHLSQAPYIWQDKEIVDLSALARVRLAVVDCLAGLESNKSPAYTPDSCNIHITNRVKMNTIVAGYDPVAVDHVCSRMIGLNPDDFEYITLAERCGLGTNDPDSISIAGTSIAQAKRVFKKAQTWSGLYGQGNRTWLLNGPFSTAGVTNPLGTDFLANESAVSPVAGTGGWSQTIYFINDQIMLNDYFQTVGAGTSNVISYAFTYVIAPADQRAEMWVGSDEALRIYLNGEIAYNYSGTRIFAGTECYKDTVTITLRKGLNRLLVKAFQGAGNYNFSVNICDIEPNRFYRGNRVWGLRFTTNPATVNAVRDTRDHSPANRVLLECYPNPFNPSTVVRYTVPFVSDVKLVMFDLLGRNVATLVNGVKEPGTYTVRFEGSGCASGVYLCRLQAGGSVLTRKLLLVR